MQQSPSVTKYPSPAHVLGIHGSSPTNAFGMPYTPRRPLWAVENEPGSYGQSVESPPKPPLGANHSPKHFYGILPTAAAISYTSSTTTARAAAPAQASDNAIASAPAPRNGITFASTFESASTAFDDAIASKPANVCSPTPEPTTVSKKAGKHTLAKAQGEKRRQKGGGKGSRSGQGNRRMAGDSDKEVEQLNSDQKAKAAVSITEKIWTDEQKTIVIKYITSPDIWKKFRSAKASVFQHVCTSFN